MAAVGSDGVDSLLPSTP